MSPDKEMNNAYLYCLIEAAQKFDIVLLLSQMMSNHQHTVLFDPKGYVIEFTHRFHTNLAKCVNAYRGRWENMWSSDPPCLVELVEPDDVIDKLIYTAANPVNDGLVAEFHHWPGPKIVQAFLGRRTLRARRPSFLFRDDGPMPAEVQLTLTIPDELGEHDNVVARVRAGITAAEEDCARARAISHRQVVGCRRIRRQSWSDSPTTPEPRRNLRPRVAARDKGARINSLQRNKEFQADYRDCRKRWLVGDQVVFPAGTYWLRRFANVPTAAIDPPRHT